MGTTAIIARRLDDGSWKGVGHAYDGYPEGLGKTLVAYAQPDGPFGGDLERMARELVDAHPSGWRSIIGRRITDPAGDGPHYERRECYCHHEEDAHLWRPAHFVCSTDREMDGNYLYVIDPAAGTLTVFGCGYSSREPWRELGVVDLWADGHTQEAQLLRVLTAR